MTAALKVALDGRLGPQFRLEVAFTVPAAGVTALLGPSGSGKTSVLRAIAGLDRLGGSITMGGSVWQDPTVFMPTHRRRVGYVPQGAGLLPNRSVGDNLAYAARRAGPGPFEYADVVARTGIGPLLDRMPARLSGGEAQRASLARALLGQPRLLLLDEPLSGLDLAGRAALLDQLSDLLRALTIPVVYVTHEVAEADRLATARICLDGGRVVP